LSSTFDNDGENWTIFGDAEGALGNPAGLNMFPEYVSTDGNPAGAIFADDDSRGVGWWFNAPPLLLGNKLGMYGGALTYDQKFVPTGPGAPTLGGPHVVMAGSSLTLVAHLGSNPAPNVWTSYAVGLDEDSGWRLQRLSGPLATAEQIRAVLKDLVVLHIRGEFAGGADRSGLDNVRFVPKGQVDK
jgi:hypothetical protein